MLLSSLTSDPHYKTRRARLRVTPRSPLVAPARRSAARPAAQRGACASQLRDGAVEDLAADSRPAARAAGAISPWWTSRAHRRSQTYGTHAGGAKDSSVWQLDRFRAKAASPFARGPLLLDTDAFPCAGYERLFDVLRHVDTAQTLGLHARAGELGDRGAAASFEVVPRAQPPHGALPHRGRRACAR